VGFPMRIFGLLWSVCGPPYRRGYRAAGARGHAYAVVNIRQPDYVHSADAAYVRLFRLMSACCRFRDDLMIGFCV
jgi:hypothetical protein